MEKEIENYRLNLEMDNSVLKKQNENKINSKNTEFQFRVSIRD